MRNLRTYCTSFAALSLLALLAGCGKKEATVAAVEAPPVRVALLRIASQPFTASVAVTGTLISNSRVEVKAETTGRILKFPKEEGAAVAAGEVVVWVNQENYNLAVAQSEAAVKVAEAALARAQVSESHGKTELERARNLVKSGGITDKDLKAAELAEQDSHAQTELAAAQLAQARSALDTAQKYLRDTLIHAPVSGEIQKKMVNVGAYVEPATAVLTLVDNSRLELESPVASADIAPIRAGQRVTFTVNAFPGQTFEGRVLEINPALEADTRSARVRVQAHNPGGKLKAGMFAQGEIQTGVEFQTIMIPAGAVYRDDRSAKGSTVFVAEGGKAVRRAVRIGHERDSTLEIVSGLKPGDMLIAEQSIEIAEGVRVEAAGGTGK
jgi:membrane fusion protein (multidrug efflux system)